MALTVAVQMDHVSSITIKGDSTFALCLEAQRRGHRLLHYTPDRLSLRDGKATARAEVLELFEEQGRHFTLGEPEKVDLAETDVVLLRQDPPFDMAYITSTHILERVHPKRSSSTIPLPCATRRRRSSSPNFPISCRKR